MDFTKVIDLIKAYHIEILLALIGLNLFFLIIIGVQALKNKKLRKNYRQFMTGMEGQPLEEKIRKLIQEAENNTVEVTHIKEEIEQLKGIMKNNLQRVGVVKYNAFSDMASDLSYAIAILDDYGTGIVMSSLYGREDFRAYAKVVENGTSKNRLTEEEQGAIKIAMDKNS